MVTGADSSLANVYEPSNDDVTKFLSKESGVTVCKCVVRKGTELIVRGRISPEDNENVEKAIEESWRQSNPGW